MFGIAGPVFAARLAAHRRYHPLMIKRIVIAGRKLPDVVAMLTFHISRKIVAVLRSDLFDPHFATFKDLTNSWAALSLIRGRSFFILLPPFLELMNGV